MCSVALGVVLLFAVFLNGIVTAAGLCTGPSSLLWPPTNGGFVNLLVLATCN